MQKFVLQKNLYDVTDMDRLLFAEKRETMIRITVLLRLNAAGRLLNFSIFRGGGGGAFIKFWRFSSHKKLKKTYKILKILQYF